MILPAHVKDHQYLADLGAFTGEMLLLGNHRSKMPGATAKEFFVKLGAANVMTLDLDGGDIQEDLNFDLDWNAHLWDSVFNLGTIEHVWNVHHAWANALRAVRVGGMFASHSPIHGYKNHGIHITGADYIVGFVEMNGFEMIDGWATDDALGNVFWMLARKLRHIDRIEEFKCPQQVYRQGRKSRSRVFGGTAGQAPI